MKKKLKKHQQKTIIKISAVLFIAWLIVSCVFSANTISAEKNAQIKKINNEFENLALNIRLTSPSTYNSMFKYVEDLKTHADKRAAGETTSIITCGADGHYDNSQQIIMYIDTVGGNHTLINTDKQIYISLSTKVNDIYTEYCGKLVYEKFINSIDEIELDNIIKHLNIKSDDSGNYYAVQLSQAYYNPENGQIIPKTIQLVKTHDSFTSSTQNEIIKTYNLNPNNTEGLKLHTLYHHSTSIIPGQFITGEFKSQGLVEPFKDPYDYLYEFLYSRYGLNNDNDVTPYGRGNFIRVSGFSYLYVSCVTNRIPTLEYSGSKLETAYLKEEKEFLADLDEETKNNPTKFLEAYDIFNSQYRTSSENWETVCIEYAKRVNILECAQGTLLVGNSFIFIFFLIVTLIIITAMYKIMQTQFSEEKKRSELTNALAHDIKSPLFIISGYAQNLKENVNTEKRDHYCDRIIDKTQEVNNLIHRMLEFSRIGSLDKLIDISKVNITQMTKEIISTYERLPDKKSFVLNCSDNCIINADKDLMYHSVSNLIANAVTYADKESEIKIDVSNNSFSISNECSSIFQSDIKHLTEPYYRVEKNRNSKGNGLGLSIVKSIADLHSHKLDIRLRNITITFTLRFS